MKNPITRIALFICVLAATCPVFAQTGGTYNLEWNTIDCGGGRSSGGSYVLSGAIGQPDAEYSAGGSYEVLGGFLVGGPLGIVNFIDYSLFSGHWLQNACNSGNNWCGGTDLDKFGDVEEVPRAVAPVNDAPRPFPLPITGEGLG